MLTTADKNYIHRAITNAVTSSQKDTERYLGILMEQNRHEFQLIRELMVVRPTHEEVDGKLQEHVSIYHSGR